MTWNPSFPFEVDYNDHFETPKQSYIDILPIIESIGRSISIPQSRLILYDPFYCNGLAKVHLESLGFANVQHERRDFYKDILNNTIPFHHIIITNPPYSDDHKERVVEFCVKRLRNENIPFFLLLPNYVACKEYFRNAIKQEGREQDPLDIFYVLPSTKYQYNHPENTGKTTCPFDSIWYCGLPESMMSDAIKSFHHIHGRTKGQAPRLARSIDELKLSDAVPTGRRRNPKQRRKERARLEAQGKEKVDPSVIPKPDAKITKPPFIAPSRKMKSSKHRDETGVRKKRRF